MPGGAEKAGRAARLQPRAGLSWHRALVWACLCPAPALAAQVDYGVGLSATYESNIFRTTTDERRELYESLMGAVFLREDNRDLAVRMLVQAEHRHFTQKTFGDDTTMFLDGAGLWTISPERFTWTLEDTFREVQLNVTAPDTPGNRTKSNTLSTGPDLTFALSSVNSVVLGGRYGRFDVDNSVTDNKRYGGYLRGIHLLSLQSRLSLNLEANRVFFEPEATPYPNVLQENFYGRYESLYAGSGVTVDFGRTVVTQYDGGQTLDGNIARLTLLKAFGTESTVRMSYSDEISDTYSDLLRGVTLAGIPTDPGVVLIQGVATADLYHSKLGSAAYLNQGGRFQYTLLAVGRKVDFATLDQDYEERTGRLYLSWLQSGAMRFSASFDYSKRNYLTLTVDPTTPGSPLREDIDRNYLATLEYKLNQSLTLTLVGNLIRRDSTAPAISYVDRRGMILLGYTFGHQFEMQSRR
ncbi:MAG TPA: hypothetical protein VJO54_15590 [Burkholderiales bacterium]|nr:hypothetical protein [Burkholderiales bacterium]